MIGIAGTLFRGRRLSRLWPSLWEWSPTRPPSPRTSAACNCRSRATPNSSASANRELDRQRKDAKGQRRDPLVGASAGCRLALTEPKSEDADELLSDGAPSFWSNPPAPILQITLASHPNEITADERFPIHAIGAIDQELILPGQSLGAMALAGEDIDRLEVRILTTIRWRDNDTRVLPVARIHNQLCPTASPLNCLSLQASFTPRGVFGQLLRFHLFVAFGERAVRIL